MKTRAFWLFWGVWVASVQHAAAASPRTPRTPQSEEAAARDRLLVPSPSRDLSAFRMDTEVFGWSADLREVSAVVMEVARGPLGRHRGETYMLVYGVNEWIPRHNVITHSITHADLPDNPVPLQEAKDFLWSIEWSYEHMWPHRPRRARAAGDMEVQTVWTPMVVPNEPGICRPWVSHRLSHKRAHRLMPYRPIDLTARCDLLRKTDTRTYWASPLLAASMVRFDFASRPQNEESGRFLLSSAWSQARLPQVELHVPSGLLKSAKIAQLLHLLQSVAPTTRHLTSTSAGRLPDVDLNGLWQADVEGGHDWLPLAIGALIDIGIAVGDVRAVDGPLKATRALTPAPTPKPQVPAGVVAKQPVPLGGPSRLQSALSAARHPRFGQDALSSDGPGRLPPSLAGESGMVDTIVEQHDPIEDAFSDGAEPPRLQSRPQAAAPAKIAGASRTPARRAAPVVPDRVRITLRRKNSQPAPATARPQRSAPATGKPKLGRLGTQPKPAEPEGQFLRDWQP